MQLLINPPSEIDCGVISPETEPIILVIWPGMKYILNKTGPQDTAAQIGESVYT
jgi:hypothetical protein